MDDLPQDARPTLEELWERHHAVARYRLIRSEGKGERTRTQVDAGLHWSVAQSECERLTAELQAASPEEATGFSRVLFLVELENPDACLSPAAKLRLAAIKGRFGPLVFAGAKT